jgi:hypothetical protein
MEYETVGTKRVTYEVELISWRHSAVVYGPKTGEPVLTPGNMLKET